MTKNELESSLNVLINIPINRLPNKDYELASITKHDIHKKIKSELGNVVKESYILNWGKFHK
jgi:hypothetical protein